METYPGLKGLFILKLVIEEIEIEVTKKKIKNLYIRIQPPHGKVSISAPYRMNNDEIRKFAQSKMKWIRSHREKSLKTPVPIQLQYVTGEQLFLWGKRYRLEVVIGNRNTVQLDNEIIMMMVKAGSTIEQRKKTLTEWFRKTLKKEIPALIRKWQNNIGVNPSGWGVKDMKTRWGTCNTQSKYIWLSLRLIHHPPRALEYVIVHELVHLLERSHNKVFTGYMDQYLPDWKIIRKEMNTMVDCKNRNGGEFYG